MRICTPPEEHNTEIEAATIAGDFKSFYLTLSCRNCDEVVDLRIELSDVFSIENFPGCIIWKRSEST